jgi:hypothetical protein
MFDMVAQVWSFTGGNNDIPYYIRRIGEAKDSGGNGIKWTCSCMAFSRRSNCKHLNIMRETVKDGSILYDERFILTEFGKKVLGV